MDNKITEFMRHLKHRVMGTYLGEGPLELHNNMKRVWDSKSQEVLIYKTNGDRVRGQLVNYEPGEGFNLCHIEEKSKKATSIIVKPKEVSRSYLVK